MATDLLVGGAISGGEELLRALDREQFPVTAALWYLNAGAWRYILASPVVDASGAKEAYRRVNDILRSAGVGMSLSDITVVSPHEPLVQVLRAVAGTAPNAVGGTRFTANTINHVFIEDAYIYRVA